MPQLARAPPVVLVANKCEGFSRDHRGLLLAHVGDGYTLGFGDPVPISAETGRGWMTSLRACSTPYQLSGQAHCLYSTVLYCTVLYRLRRSTTA